MARRAGQRGGEDFREILNKAYGEPLGVESGGFSVGKIHSI